MDVISLHSDYQMIIWKYWAYCAFLEIKLGVVGLVLFPNGVIS